MAKNPRRSFSPFWLILCSACFGSSASGSVLPLSYQWTSLDGINVVQSGPLVPVITTAIVPNNYDISNTLFPGVLVATVPGSVGGSNPLGFEFYDDYVFSVTGAISLAVASTISFNLGLTSLEMRLFQLTSSLPYLQSPPAGVLVQASATPILCGPSCFANYLVLPNTFLSAGTYALALRGILSGSSSANYTGSINLASLPVPAAAWLLASALGLMTVVRRKVASANA